MSAEGPLPVFIPSGRSKEGASEKQPAAGRPASNTPLIHQPKFEGKCDGLKGHIYDCSDAKQSDVYVRTTKEIAGGKYRCSTVLTSGLPWRTCPPRDYKAKESPG